MKRRLLWLGATLTVMTLGIGGVTLALFTATAPQAQGEFVAGTLRLSGQRSGGDTVPGPIFYLGESEGDKPTGHWAPGDKQIRWFEIQNTGSLSARMTKITASMPADADLTLAEQLHVKVTDEYATLVAEGQLTAFLAEPGLPFEELIELDSGDILTLTFEVSLPPELNNDFQGTSADAVTFSVSAVQVKNN